MGTIALRLPLPPGCLPTLWGSDERMRSSYLATFPGYYDTSDAGVIDADGYIYGAWAAPTTSSTSRATACPRAAWRRCWPATRTSPNARSSASATR